MSERIQFDNMYGINLKHTWTFIKVAKLETSIYNFCDASMSERIQFDNMLL